MTNYPTPRVRTIKGNPYAFVGHLLRQLEGPAQTFEIDPRRKTTFLGQHGTRLTINPHSFCDRFGQLVSEPLTLHLREVFTKTDLLLSNKMTASEDRVMESAGQLWLLATRKKEVLELIQPICVDLPVKPGLRNPLSVRLYRGSTAYTRGFYPEDLFDWSQVDAKPLPINRTGGKKYFRFWLYQFNWINCLASISRRKGRNMVSAKPVSPVKKFDDLMAFLIFSDNASIARMYHTNGHYTAFNIPGKQTVKVLMVGTYEGLVYYGSRTIRKTSNCQVFVEMQEVSKSNLIAKLNAL